MAYYGFKLVNRKSGIVNEDYTHPSFASYLINSTNWASYYIIDSNGEKFDTRDQFIRHISTSFQPEEIDAMQQVETTANKIAAACDRVKEMLLAKNAAYGDSALSPVRIFSKSSTEEQILVRIDDKLSRLSRGSAAGEDVIDDLIGYLILLKIARG